MFSLSRTFTLLGLCTLLVACGGGGGSLPAETDTTTTPLPQVNNPPSISGTPGNATESKAYRFLPSATDVDGDTLSFSILNKPAWASFNQQTGELHGMPMPEHVGIATSVSISVSDGRLSAELAFDLAVSIDQLEEAVRSGKASLINHDSQLLEALLQTIESTRTRFDDAAIDLFGLNSDGSTNNTSLTNISWNPTHDAALLKPQFGNNVAILNTNSVTQSSYEVASLPIGVVGATEHARYLVLGSNPMRNAFRDENSVNQDMHEFLVNSINWLTQRNATTSPPIKVVLAQLGQNYFFPDETATRDWLDTKFSNTVSYNQANACDGTALANCLSADTDLLVISQYLNNGEDAGQVAEAVEQAMNRGTPVLYMHYNGENGALAEALFPLFSVRYVQDNFWRKLQLTNFDGRTLVNAPLAASEQSVNDLMSRFLHDDFSFDLSLCEDKSCPDTSTYGSEFGAVVQRLRQMIDDLDRNKIDVFAQHDQRYQKLLVLLADFYRQSVIYPMDKTITDTKTFLQSLYADHIIHNFRTLNPAQVDMGNFSRSNFSHVTPRNVSVTLASHTGFTAAGVYALPGQTFTVTRNDTSAVVTKVFINTLRSGATHQFEEFGYNRPKHLRSAEFLINPGESLAITSPHGGLIQVSFDAPMMNVELQFSNVGQHPFWQSSTDDATFAAALEKGDYDWAELVTPSFQVHSTLEKMRQTIADEKWGTANALSTATERYLHRYPHRLAGFTGPGIDTVPEVSNFASQHNLQLVTLDQVKHMNADQATCGAGCSGNPYDANWSFDPISHGDLHELGHGLEKRRFRFEGWDLHASTNPYSYYSKSQYYKDTNDSSALNCQVLPFEAMFNTLQQSANQADPAAYMRSANLTTWQNGAAIMVQMMMAAQDQGALQDGWNIMPRLHIVERAFSLATQDDALWQNQRTSLGFTGVALADARALNNNDWMLIALSHVLARDMRDYLDMWGLTTGPLAREHIAQFNYSPLRREFYVSEATEYCLGLDKPALPIDGNQSWPNQ